MPKYFHEMIFLNIKYCFYIGPLSNVSNASTPKYRDTNQNIYDHLNNVFYGEKIFSYNSGQEHYLVRAATMACA